MAVEGEKGHGWVALGGGEEPGAVTKAAAAAAAEGAVSIFS